MHKEDAIIRIDRLNPSSGDTLAIYTNLDVANMNIDVMNDLLDKISDKYPEVSIVTLPYGIDIEYLSVESLQSWISNLQYLLEIMIQNKNSQL